MRLFLAIFIATLILGPLFAVAFYVLGAFVVEDLPTLLSWLARLAGGEGRPRLDLDTPALLREHGPLLLKVSYALGGLPAALGGAFLGWRFTRSPPRIGPVAPLALGGVLGLALVPIFTGLRPTSSTLSFALVVLAISVACAASCWAIARMIHRSMAPAEGAQTVG